MGWMTVRPEHSGHDRVRCDVISCRMLHKEAEMSCEALLQNHVLSISEEPHLLHSCEGDGRKKIRLSPRPETGLGHGLL